MRLVKIGGGVWFGCAVLAAGCGGSGPMSTLDGRHALIYVQVTCAGRCSGHALLLLERRDERWVVLSSLAGGVG